MSICQREREERCQRGNFDFPPSLPFQGIVLQSSTSDTLMTAPCTMQGNGPKWLSIRPTHFMVMEAMFPLLPFSSSSSASPPPPSIIGSSRNTGTNILDPGYTGTWGKSMWRMSSCPSWRYPVLGKVRATVAREVSGTTVATTRRGAERERERRFDSDCAMHKEDLHPYLGHLVCSIRKCGAIYFMLFCDSERGREGGWCNIKVS